MTDTIQLGAGLTCDLAVLAETRLLVNAASGGGKSRTIRRLLEQSHGKIQHIVIDPEGEFASLRERFDYVIASKHGGDAVADPRSAALLATKLLELGVSAVVDIFDLKRSNGERAQFVKIFLETMMAAPKSLWHPVLVVLDEAHQFAPEDAEAVSRSVVEDLASQGRKRGFCLVAATQRLSKLSKDVAAELRNVMIGTTVLDVDQKRAADVLGFDKAARIALRDVEAGWFWTYGPALVRAPTLVHMGPVVTTHPKVGDRKAMPAPPPTARIKALLPQLADLPAEAEEKARTEADLRRDLAAARGTITRLERAAPIVKTESNTVKVVEKPVLKDGQLARAEKLLAQFDGAMERIGAVEDAIMNKVVIPMQAAATEIANAIALTKLVAPTIGPARHPIVIDPKPELRRRAAALAMPSVTPGNVIAGMNGNLSKGQRKILNAMAELYALGVDATTRGQLGLFASYNLTGGTGAQHIADLVAAGLVQIPSPGVLALTFDGHHAADGTEVPRSLEDLHNRVFAKISSGQVKILKHLLEIYPTAISRADLGAAAEYNLTGGTGAQHVADLVNLGAVTIPSPGKVVASALMFPEALR